MVIFILCLTVIVLSTIATCRFIIDRPRKKRYKQLKEYLNKRKQNLFQSTTGSHGSLNRDKLLGSNPSMIIVPHNTHNNHHHHHLNDSNTHGGSQQFDPCEAESLLPGAHASNASLPSFQDEPVSNSSTSNFVAGNGGLASASAALAAATPAAASSSSTALPFSNQTHGKIYFSVGETILEDLAGEATSSDARDKTPEPDQAANTNSSNSNSDNNANGDNGNSEPPKDSTDLEGTEEALKTVSHLLDDKPWSLTRRDSKLLPPEKSNLASVASQTRMNP